MKSKSHRYFLPSPWGTQTSHCDSDWCGREWCVTRVTGQLTDGSRGSWVIKCDSLSALPLAPATMPTLVVLGLTVEGTKIQER